MNPRNPPSKFWGRRDDVDDFNLRCRFPADATEAQCWHIYSRHRTRTDGGQRWHRWVLPLDYPCVYGPDATDIWRMEELVQRIITGQDPTRFLKEHGGHVYASEHD